MKKGRERWGGERVDLEGRGRGKEREEVRGRKRKKERRERKERGGEREKKEGRERKGEEEKEEGERKGKERKRTPVAWGSLLSQPGSLVTGAGACTVSLCLEVLQMSNDITSDSEKLNQLQKIIHPQQDNLSEPLNISRNGPSEEYLQSQISALLERQEQMATKLCKEFLIHTSGNLTYIFRKATSSLSP